MTKPEIKTARTILTLISADDLAPVAALNADPEVRNFFPNGVQTREQTRQKLQQFRWYYETFGLPYFVMRDKSSYQFIGRSGFEMTGAGEIKVSYLIARRYWGMGYATEALQAILDWGRHHLKTDLIIACAPVLHHASHRVMEKSGMEHYKNGIARGVDCRYYRIRIRPLKDDSY